MMLFHTVNFFCSCNKNVCFILAGCAGGHERVYFWRTQFHH